MPRGLAGSEVPKTPSPPPQIPDAWRLGAGARRFRPMESPAHLCHFAADTAIAIRNSDGAALFPPAQQPNGAGS